MPYADVQYRRLAQLAVALRRRYPVADIVGHSDIAPARKTDPGPEFDWPRLRALVGDARRR
jgi:AmpD protein